MKIKERTEKTTYKENIKYIEISKQFYNNLIHDLGYDKFGYHHIKLELHITGHYRTFPSIDTKVPIVIEEEEERERRK